MLQCPFLDPPPLSDHGVRPRRPRTQQESLPDVLGTSSCARTSRSHAASPRSLRCARQANKSDRGRAHPDDPPRRGPTEGDSEKRPDVPGIWGRRWPRSHPPLRVKKMGQRWRRKSKPARPERAWCGTHDFPRLLKSRQVVPGAGFRTPFEHLSTETGQSYFPMRQNVACV